MEIFNNTTRVVKDDLEKQLRSGSRVSIAAASFSIYAYQELKKQLESCEELRFIFTSPTFVAEKTPKERREFYIPRLKHYVFNAFAFLFACLLSTFAFGEIILCKDDAAFHRLFENHVTFFAACGILLLRTCIHNRCTLSGRSFPRRTASIFLAIRQDCFKKFPCPARKFLAHPASPGYEYRF